MGAKLAGLIEDGKTLAPKLTRGGNEI